MLLFLLFSTVLGYFAGDGINTYAYTINGQVDIQMCYTNDGCYMLMCYFLSDPSYELIIIQPNPWVGSCEPLVDNRVLNGIIVTFVNNVYDQTYNVVTVSNMSQLLCQLGQNKTVNEIDYISQCLSP